MISRDHVGTIWAANHSFVLFWTKWKAIDGATDGNFNKINLQGNNLQNAQLNKVFEAASCNKLKDLIAKAKEDDAAAQAASNTL